MTPKYIRIAPAPTKSSAPQFQFVAAKPSTMKKAAPPVMYSRIHVGNFRSSSFDPSGRTKTPWTSWRSTDGRGSWSAWVIGGVIA